MKLETYSFRRLLNLWIFPLCLAGLALFIRYPLVHTGTPFYNADMAILDLMARHFAKGEFSVYYWGQNYYGALDPFLILSFFHFLGRSPLVSQLVPYFSSAAFLLLYHRFLIKTTTVTAAHIATLILAVGSPFFIGVAFSNYGYILALVLGFAFFLGLPKILQPSSSALRIFLFGVLMGFSWYYLQVILFFWIAAIIPLVLPKLTPDHLRFMKSQWKALSLGRFWHEVILLEGLDLPRGLKGLLVLVNVINLVNLAVAMVLWVHGDWIGTIQGHTVKLFFKPIFGSSLKMTVGVFLVVFWKSVFGIIRQVHQRVSLKVLGAGFLVGYSPAIVGRLQGHSPSAGGGFPTLSEMLRTAWGMVFEVFPVMTASSGHSVVNGTVALLFLAGMGTLVMAAYTDIRHHLTRPRSDPTHPMVWLGLANLIVISLYSKIADASCSRYLLLFYICVPLGIAWFLERTIKWKAVRFLLVGLFIYGNYRAVAEHLAGAPAVASHASTAAYLRAKGYAGGYAEYWTAYLLTSQTDENVIVVPTGDNDRYAPYLNYVRSLKQVVLVGESLPPDQTSITLKGVPYRVLSTDLNSHVPITLLEKVL